MIFPPFPILPDTDVASQAPAPALMVEGSSPHADRQISGHSEDGGTKRVWMPKMDFPKFDGTDLRIWLDKCST